MAMSLSRSLRAMAACKLRPKCTSTSVPIVSEDSSDVGSPLGSSDSNPVFQNEINRINYRRPRYAWG